MGLETQLRADFALDKKTQKSQWANSERYGLLVKESSVTKPMIFFDSSGEQIFQIKKGDVFLSGHFLPFGLTGFLPEKADICAYAGLKSIQNFLADYKQNHEEGLLNDSGILFGNTSNRMARVLHRFGFRSFHKRFEDDRTILNEVVSLNNSKLDSKKDEVAVMCDIDSLESHTDQLERYLSWYEKTLKSKYDLDNMDFQNKTFLSEALSFLKTIGYN